jgi:hypothetical protein
MDVPKRSPEERSERETAEWDAEIEAEFQRAVRQTRTTGQRRRQQREFVGCPVAFLVDVCRLTKGRAAAMVALCIYRRTRVCSSQTVTLPAAELGQLGVSSSRKQRTLIELQRAGLIEVGLSRGRTSQVTLKWQQP